MRVARRCCAGSGCAAGGVCVRRRIADAVDLCGDGGGGWSWASTRRSVAVELRVLQRYLSAADQDDRGAADPGDAGDGDCGAWGSEERWADGAEGLVYFEVVTTLALVIGLVAINVTQGGCGD